MLPFVFNNNNKYLLTIYNFVLGIKLVSVCVWSIKLIKLSKIIHVKNGRIGIGIPPSMANSWIHAFHLLCHVNKNENEKRNDHYTPNLT